MVNYAIDTGTLDADALQEWALNSTKRAAAFGQDLVMGNVNYNTGTKAWSIVFISAMVWWSFEVLRAVGVCTIAGAASKWLA